MDHPLTNRRDWLAIAAAAFLAANLLHGADHVRQGVDDVGVAVKIGGALLTVAAIEVFRRRRHPGAALLATIVGFTAAVAVVASHVAPHWSILSDSYLDDVSPDALSWAVMLAEVAAGFMLGVVGLRRLERTAPRPVTAGSVR